ncbi:MAG: hypothetical protein KBD05_03550 [Candidatus Pacebacteria bacterium]|nr:hypothetical protein [Candidatus Paceibacterota bacterium]
MTDNNYVHAAAALGAPDLTPELAQRFIERIGPDFLIRVLGRAEELLSPEDRDTAARFITEEDGEGLMVFLKERLPNFSELLAEALSA